MPYFVYKIQAQKIALVKNLQSLAQFDRFKTARNFAREKRMELDSAETADQIKVIFADSELHAEEQLSERRDQPILMEHEK